MDYIQDYFECGQCQNRDFKQIFTFSMKFHGVNFSDDLIYDRLTEEKYQCTQCQKTFTITEIEEGLNLLKKNRKKR
ncbi:MAG: hypothetical protein ABII06_00125 [Pseudomonadota bacterium]